MFLPPTTASAGTTILTPTRLNQGTASLGLRLPIPAPGWFASREEWRWQRRTMVSTCSKEYWFFPCNSTELKSRFQKKLAYDHQNCHRHNAQFFRSQRHIWHRLRRSLHQPFSVGDVRRDLPAHDERVGNGVYGAGLAGGRL